MKAPTVMKEARLLLQKARTNTSISEPSTGQQPQRSDNNNNQRSGNGDDDENYDNDTNERISLSLGWIDHQLDYLRDHPLHPINETILAWLVAMLCLLYYGYQYVSMHFSRHQPKQRRKRRIPLMTEANVGRSKKHVDPIDQVQELYHNICDALVVAIDTIDNSDSKSNGHDAKSIHHSDLESVGISILNSSKGRNDNNDTELHDDTTATAIATSSTKLKHIIIHAIRSNPTLRRWVSQYTVLLTTMLPPPQLLITEIRTTENSTSTNTIQKSTSHHITLDMKRLYLLFDNIWNDLLRLPSVSSVSLSSSSPSRYSNTSANATTTMATCPYLISLVIPLYRECGKMVVHTTLRVAWQNCHQPQCVQIILVDAGQCRNTSIIHEYMQQQKQKKEVTDQSNGQIHRCNWGDIQYVLYSAGGGRGPCQNYGAQLAQGRYITFLHSDTLIPYHWDKKVQNALNRTSRNDSVITHACSFSVGHDVSKEGLGTLPYPYGIRSILLLGNVRAWLFRLPYGDHILSFHTKHFHYIGGFPDQPIMEDYAIMDLLRQRAAAVPTVETLRIIPPPTGQCSVRRWQKYGVVYVTLVNALLVHRYAYGGWTADDVFSYYYMRPMKQKTQ